eukprot:4660038-Pleurochrysis_carterae.AAC.1
MGGMMATTLPSSRSHSEPWLCGSTKVDLKKPAVRVPEIDLEGALLLLPAAGACDLLVGRHVPPAVGRLQVAEEVVQPFEHFGGHWRNLDLQVHLRLFELLQLLRGFQANLVAPRLGAHIDSVPQPRPNAAHARHGTAQAPLAIMVRSVDNLTPARLTMDVPSAYRMRRTQMRRPLFVFSHICHTAKTGSRYSRRPENRAWKKSKISTTAKRWLFQPGV